MVGLSPTIAQAAIGVITVQVLTRKLAWVTDAQIGDLLQDDGNRKEGADAYQRGPITPAATRAPLHREQRQDQQAADQATAPHGADRIEMVEHGLLGDVAEAPEGGREQEQAVCQHSRHRCSPTGQATMRQSEARRSRERVPLPAQSRI